MYEESAIGTPLRRIAAGLAHDGILTPMGKSMWDPTTVRVILIDPR
jgi:hypothetical protein